MSAPEDWAGHPQELPAWVALRIGTTRTLRDETVTPQWASFFVHLGWWLAELPTGDAITYCVVRTPTRKCCAALTALGTVLSSASRRVPELTWSAFSALPTGTLVYFQRAGKTRAVHYSGRILESSTSEYVSVGVQGWKGETRVSRTSFPQSGFQLEPFLHQRTQAQLDRLGALLGPIIPGFSAAWLLSEERCCTVVTKLVEWNEEARELALTGVEQAGVVLSLHDVIYAMPHRDRAGGRVVAVSALQRDANVVATAPIIADGPRALAALDGILFRKAILFLDHLEYDSAVATQLAMLASRRRDDSVIAVGSFCDAAPPGVDVVLFALDPPTAP